MKRVKKVLGLVIVLGIIAMAFCACAPKVDPIVIGEGDWDSNIFHDQVAKIIIEEGYGYETDIVTADTSVLLAGFKANDIDISFELWTDNIPTYEQDISDGMYMDFSTNFDDNRQGLYVPTYLVEGPDALAPDLKTVEDLKDYVDLFPNPEEPGMGIIYGGPEGWKVTEFMYKKMEAYGLNEYYEFKPIDSNATLSATLASAYEKGEPWVGYNWEPTWIMGMYDMTLLEDSEYNAEDYENGIGECPTVNVTVAGTSEFAEAYPDVVEFLNNYTTSSALTSSALAYMQENDVEAPEAAVWFLQENQDLWKEWVPEDVYQKVLKAIE